MADDHNDRLTILERAQQLHDAVLERHEADLARHQAILDELRESNRQQAALNVRLEGRLAQHEDQMAQQRLTHRRIAEGFDQLHAALLAIKDLLERGQNGR